MVAAAAAAAVVAIMSSATAAPAFPVPAGCAVGSYTHHHRHYIPEWRPSGGGRTLLVSTLSGFDKAPQCLYFSAFAAFGTAVRVTVSNALFTLLPQLLSMLAPDFHTATSQAANRTTHLLPFRSLCSQHVQECVYSYRQHHS